MENFGNLWIGGARANGKRMSLALAHASESADFSFEIFSQVMNFYSKFFFTSNVNYLTLPIAIIKIDPCWSIKIAFRVILNYFLITDFIFEKIIFWTSCLYVVNEYIYVSIDNNEVQLRHRSRRSALMLGEMNKPGIMDVYQLTKNLLMLLFFFNPCAIAFWKIKSFEFSLFWALQFFPTFKNSVCFRGKVWQCVNNLNNRMKKIVFPILQTHQFSSIFWFPFANFPHCKHKSSIFTQYLPFSNLFSSLLLKFTQ